MKLNDRQTIGKQGLEVTRMGFGGAPFGNLFTAISDSDVAECVAAAHSAGIRYFDTAPLYGYGLSERRYGANLPRYDRDEFAISTKVGYSLVPRTEDDPTDQFFVDHPPFKPAFDYSADAVKRSLEGSLERLKTDRVDIVYIHDPDEVVSVQPAFDPYSASHFREAMDGAYPVLDDLRFQGVIKAVGVGMNQWQMLADFARAGDFDCFLLAGRYTLLEQESLHGLLSLCVERGVRIVVGGPYNSGILVTGAIEGAYYNYAPAPPHILRQVSKIQEVCERHGVRLPSAALQFPLAHPAVACVIPGGRTRAEVEANAGLLEEEIPADFWAELKSEGLVDEEAPVPSLEI